MESNLRQNDGKTARCRSIRLCRITKRIGKTAVSLVLCFALVFGYTYKHPVKVEAAAIVAPAIDALIIAGLAALGVAVAGTVTDTDMGKFVNEMKTNAVTAAAGVCTAAEVGGALVYNVTKDFLNTLGNQFNTWQNGLTQAAELNKLVVPLEGTTQYYDANSLFTAMGYPPTHGLYENGYGPNLSNIKRYVILGTMPFVFEGTGTYAYSGSTLTIRQTTPNYEGSRSFYYTRNGSQEYSVWFRPMDTLIYGYAVYFLLSNGQQRVVIYNGNPDASTYNSNVLTVWYQGSGDAAIPEAPGHDVIFGNDKVSADGASILNNPVSDVVDRVGNAVGAQDGSIPLNIPAEGDKSIGKARDVTQDKVLGKDIATDADRDRNTDTNKDKDTSPPKPGELPDLSLPELITRKFPFSIPWDLKNAVSGLVASPEPPKFVYPIKLQRLGIDQSITIDFSGYGTLAAISRWALYLGFLLWLIVNTRKLLGN